MDNLNKQIPNAVSPALEEITAEVYPNPFVGELTIQLKNKADEIALYDITGKLVYRTLLSGNSVVIHDLGDLHSGIYLLKIVEGNQSITQKLIKK